MVPTLPIQITCPKCGHKYGAQVLSVVDVGREPQLKALLLRGALNMVVCPACGTPGRVGAPLLYHDPRKELLLLYLSPELNLPMAERERLTGSMVTALMSMVPQEQRKGYFLNPRPVLTMQGLIDEILKADGVTKEMIEEQRARSQLLQKLLLALDDDTQLNALVEQNKGQIDYPFLLTLATALDSSAASGQKQLAERLLKLRDALLARVPIALPEPLPEDASPAEVVDKLRALKDKEARWAFVLYNRPLVDYHFFEQLTKRIESAAPEEAEALRALRTELLEMTERLDKESLALQEAKIQLLRDAMASPDPLQTLRERSMEIDTLFLAILGAALRSAQEKGQTEETQRLQAVNEASLKVLQEDLPPELKLVNELLAADYPQGTEKLLRERQAEWDAEFPQMLDALAQDLDERQRPETVQRLREIRAQAEAILQPVSKP